MNIASSKDEYIFNKELGIYSSHEESIGVVVAILRYRANLFAKSRANLFAKKRDAARDALAPLAAARVPRRPWTGPTTFPGEGKG